MAIDHPDEIVVDTAQKRKIVLHTLPYEETTEVVSEKRSEAGSQASEARQRGD